MATEHFNGSLRKKTLYCLVYAVRTLVQHLIALLQLEMVSEAARNDKIVTLLPSADDSMRAQVKLLLAGP